METIVCKNCGASKLIREQDYYYCEYCDSKLYFSKPATASEITLSSDIERLLQKCRTDRKNARKYANLILDIDPDNAEALMYL
ncbi:MAG: hypothetical protein IJN00_00015 [Clostridia bacterium]|nr:hypothetical protein [Clostridia bacterium]